MKRTTGHQFVRSILHPTDFSEASARAFAQALAISLPGSTKLVILHVGPESEHEVDWSSFPHVRSTLERWGLLDPDSPRSAVYDEFDLRVGKFAVHSRHPVLAITDFLKNKPVDLIVLGTESRDGLLTLNKDSTAEALARWSNCMTLLVPRLSARGLVSIHDGSGSIRNILIPVDSSSNPALAIGVARRAALALGDSPVRLTLLHVGDNSQPLSIPHDDGDCTWHGLLRQGEPVDQILSTARELHADLIVMTTAGHDSIGDVLRGSTTEQVLRGAPCPLLAVPCRSKSRRRQIDR